jgi:methylmalonyl-CoA/ethylmalonyl-CoA epimerase
MTMVNIEMQFPAGADLRLHHIGLVVRAIEESRAFYLDVLQYKECTPIIHDPVQTAFVQFFSIPDSDHYVELVAPDSETSKLRKASRKGKPLNHLCYSCENIGHMVSWLKHSGCFVIQDPVPAVAFSGLFIAWLMAADGLLIELVERGPEGSL